MRWYMAIPTYILLFTGYFCKNIQVAAGTTSPATKMSSKTSHGLTTSKLHLMTKTSKPTSSWEGRVPAKGYPNILVAVLSISLVFICIIIAVCIYCVIKRSRKGSVEINSDPSGEAGLSLKTSKHEKQFERRAVNDVALN